MTNEEAIETICSFKVCGMRAGKMQLQEALNMAINSLKGGWIKCKDRLPEEKINPITQDFYEYQCTFKNGDVYDIRSYKFGKGHWWHGPGIVDEYVIAWMPLSEPYKEEVKT